MSEAVRHCFARDELIISERFQLFYDFTEKNFEWASGTGVVFSDFYVLLLKEFEAKDLRSPSKKEVSRWVKNYWKTGSEEFTSLSTQVKHYIVDSSGFDTTKTCIMGMRLKQKIKHIFALPLVWAILCIVLQYLFLVNKCMNKSFSF